MASENTVLHEKLAEAVRIIPCLSLFFSLSENISHPTGPLSVYTFLFSSSPSSAEQQWQQENFVFVRHFENVARPLPPRLHSGAHCACVCQFPCAYATSVNIRYAYVYACAYAYVAV